jgi:4-azaleucine resistance transporter AzlC
MVDRTAMGGAAPGRAGLLAQALRATLPVFLGYSTIGLAFGLLLVTSGLPWWLAPLMSVVIYAGAAQFMAIGLLVQGRGLLEMALLVFLVNARHMVYGLSLLGPFSEAGRWKPYLVYALTDETYGLLTTVEPPAGHSRADFYALVSALDQAYWVLGSLLGALAGSLMPAGWTEGLDFALTALFIVLLVEQARAMPRATPYLVGLGAAVLSFVLLGPSNFLVGAILFSIGGMILLRPLVEAGAGAGGAGREEGR